MFRVMCVDDNRDIADSEAQLLQVCGFDARAYYDGASALREAATFRPTVCLIDLNMPGMSGDELAVRLRKQEGGPPPVLIAVTARDDEQSQARIHTAGLAPHLVKPVDPVRLLAAVTTAAEADGPAG
jgi:two-component system OmpR family response regulator